MSGADTDDVVQLAVGTYNLSSTIELANGVDLQGTSATDATIDTVSHALTRWSNVRGLEVHVGFVRADLERYGILVNIREPGFQGRAEIAEDTGSALGDFGAVCVERAEHATRRAD